MAYQIYQPRGPLSAEDARRQLALDACEPSMSDSWLVDLSAADLSINCHEELAGFGRAVAGAIDAARCDHCRVGIVAPDDLTYGLSHVVRAYVLPQQGQVDIAVLRDRSHAIEWLDDPG